MTIKLDVCGGSYPMGGDYRNVDRRYLPGVDVVADIAAGLPFLDGSIGEMVSCGTLEHFSPAELKSILCEFYRVLADGTKLVIGVPDLQAIMNAYLLGDMESGQVNQYLYGGQKNPFDYHKIGFDFMTLNNLLKDAGFVECRQVPYSFPFHIPKYMLQVECTKRVDHREKEAPPDRTAQHRSQSDTSSDRLRFTGERMVPDDPELNDLYVKHQARYRFASQYVNGLSVLDAGCGCGYGTHQLSLSRARMVTGIDISEAAVRYSKMHYGVKNAAYLTADCLSMPFEEGAFDCVVSFEVLEHLHAYKQYLDECRRVLTHQGLFFVSTPNKKIWAEKENPFHFKEFFYHEFRDLLASKFEVVDILGQSITPGYGVRNENNARMGAFQSALINYYDDSFAYAERQMRALAKSVDMLVDNVKKQTGEKLLYLHRSQMDTYHEINSVIREIHTGLSGLMNEAEINALRIQELNGIIAQLADQQHRSSKEMYNRLPASLFWSFLETILPSRVKRMVPQRMGKWLKRRLSVKLAAVLAKNLDIPRPKPIDRPEHQPIHSERRAGSHRRISLPENPARGMTAFPGLPKVGFPVNKDRKKIVRPAIQNEPYGFADIAIRKEFIEDAHYFIAICRKV